MSRWFDALCLVALLANLVSATTAWAADSLSNSVGMALIAIPIGTYEQGSANDDPRAEADELPRHRVTIARSFWLGAHEVTQGQYQQIMGENPSWFRPQGAGGELVVGVDHTRLPVDMVSWHDALEFCRRLSELPAERAARRQYRLPSEAEWEYACRAGTTTPFAFGDELHADDAQVTVNDRAPKTTRLVGSFAPNAWGLFDMHGNVWEWCSDPYRYDAYDPRRRDQRNEPSTGTGHVVRGGDWRATADTARSANRDFTRSTRRDLGNGFRVVMEVEPKAD
jgi:formylglycine-generating enzyme required for sulfatase activity